MNTVRQLRKSAGVTQAELARKAGTSQSTIAAYESGSKSPTLRTLDRLAEALGLSIRMKISPALTREDQRSLALHESIAKKLRAQPQQIVERAIANLAKMRQLHPYAEDLLDRWNTWLNQPPTKLAKLIVEVDEQACDMRQVSPFSGVLSPVERTRVLRQFREALSP